MPTRTRRQRTVQREHGEANELDARTEEILAQTRLRDARPQARFLAIGERRLEAALQRGDAKTANDLSLTIKRIREDLGLSFSQRPPEADANSVLWLRVLAKAAAAVRFEEAHLEEVRLQEALALDLSRTRDEGTRERLAALTADLKAAWTKELPLLFRQEMVRLCEERGLEAAPDWLAIPQRWV